MATCLLQNIDDYDKADMQSATIILGLMPTILSYIGPTIGEIALLSSRRPVLAVLVMLGAPAVFATRPFDYNSPAESLKKDIGSFVLYKQTPLRAAAITIAQYLLLCLAVANCLLNSVQLGTSTILSWKCLWPYLELGWNVMPLASHLCAALSLWCSKVGQSLHNLLCVSTTSKEAVYRLIGKGDITNLNFSPRPFVALTRRVHENATHSAS